jgi:hypothetical protein
VTVNGVNLGGVRTVKVEPAASDRTWQTVPLRVKTAHGEVLDKLRLAVISAPEAEEHEPNDTPAEAQRVTIPSRLMGTSGVPQQDWS